ncbi:hypothetical protein A5798_001858 [Enterococcus sp. 6C8_DIV0013]|nr:hypothetical protein A5798_001858 [Enterococcus sp. 6C8_DIV0013]
MGKKQSVAIIKILIGNLLMGFAYAKWMKPNEIINGGVTSVAMILEKITGINILFLTNGVTILSVSYTHLDVYKRQGFIKIKIRICRH